MAITRHCTVIACGRLEYLFAWDLQRRLHRQVSEGVLPSLLLLLEHPHVYTLGRRGSDSDILATPEQLSRLNVEVHRVDRGGEVTYHGPGQLIGYPIVDLRRWGGGPLRYVSALEQVIVATLAEIGIDSNSHQKPRGVWTRGAKIASIGVKVSRGTTTHGFALNVSTDLAFFEGIVPCGIIDGSVTSIAAQHPGITDLSSVIMILARHFSEILGMKLEWGTLSDLEKAANLKTPHR